jgi:hypothetical protein
MRKNLLGCLIPVAVILGKTLRKLQVLDASGRYHRETKLWTTLTCEFQVDKLGMTWVRACEPSRKGLGISRFAALGL